MRVGMLDTAESINRAVEEVKQALHTAQEAASKRSLAVETLLSLIDASTAAGGVQQPELPASFTPDERTFSLSGGDPVKPEGRQLQHAQPLWDSWASKLAGANSILQHTSPIMLQSSVSQLSQAPVSESNTAVAGGTLIQELPSMASLEVPPQQPATLPLVQLLLISSLHAPAAGLQASWASNSLSAAAAALVATLCQQSTAAADQGKAQRQQSGQGGSAAAQRMLTAAFRPACKYWRDYLLRQPKTEQDRLVPYTGIRAALNEPGWQQMPASALT